MHRCFFHVISRPEVLHFVDLYCMQLFAIHRHKSRTWCICLDQSQRISSHSRCWSGACAGGADTRASCMLSFIQYAFFYIISYFCVCICQYSEQFAREELTLKENVHTRLSTFTATNEQELDGLPRASHINRLVSISGMYHASDLIWRTCIC